VDVFVVKRKYQLKTENVPLTSSRYEDPAVVTAMPRTLSRWRHLWIMFIDCR